MNPSVSVIIPTYNRADFLPFAIESALGQALPPQEILVVDDVSTDVTAELMQARYASNPLVKYMRLDENGGPTIARHIGAQQAAGELIAFLDSDDVWLPNHLQIAGEVFDKHPDAVAVLTQRGQIDHKGNVTAELIAEPYSGNISDILLKRVIFHPSRLVVRKNIWFELIKNTPQIVPAPRFAEDYYHGVCLTHNYGNQVHILPNRTVWMRAHGNQSFHSARRLKGSLLKAVDQIFVSFPDLCSLKPKTQAANLFHASYFLWLTGDWIEAWRTLGEGIRTYPQGIGLRDFWISLSRLLVPPRARGWLRNTD